MATGVEVGTAYVTVLPSTQGFHKALAAQVDPAAAKAGTSGGKAYTGSFSKSLTGIGAAMAGAFTVGAIANFTKSAISSASDLAESQSKVAVVFGSSSTAIEEWASTSATSMLMSSQTALEAAGTYGNLFQAFGVGQKKAADMSQNLVQLAADMASFNNTSVDDALLALRSGLSGEAEPLKAYGVALTDARLKQEAMAEGLYDGTGAMDAATKAQASYALILHDTALAQGDVKRTGNGLANQTKSVGAALENLQTAFGTGILTGFGDVGKAGDQMSKAMQDMTGAVTAAGNAIGEEFADVSTIVTSITTITTAASGMVSALGPLDKILTVVGAATNPVTFLLDKAASAADGATEQWEKLTGANAKAAAETASFSRNMSFAAAQLYSMKHMQAFSDPVVKGVNDVADAAVLAATGIGDLRSAIEQLTNRNTLRSSSLGIRGQWAALDTMGDTVQVGHKASTRKDKHGKTISTPSTLHSVQQAFDPDIAKGRFANTESGRAAEQWTLDLAQQYRDRATLLVDQGKLKAAAQLYSSAQGKLAGQFGDWGLSARYARSFLPTPPLLTTQVGLNDWRTAQATNARRGDEGTRSVVNNYNFSGDITVKTVAEAAARALEVKRLIALSHGQIPQAADLY